MDIPDIGREAERELGPVMESGGLSVDGRSEYSITYRDQRRLVTFSYYREELPEPMLMVSVGLRADDGTMMVVGLWRLFPDSAAIRDQKLNRFTSTEQLAQRLAVVRDEWLARYIWPVLRDPDRILQAWQAQEAERYEEYDREVLKAQLKRARAAYESDDHAAAVEAYAEIGSDRLSAADQRRYVMARRATGAAGPE